MKSQNTADLLSAEFQPGSSVIYAMHGKCSVLGTEVRSLGGDPIQFYKLEIKRSTLSRSQKQEPAIWVPVAKAKDRGLRRPMDKAEAEMATKILGSREYFFKLNESWSQIQPLLEGVIRTEGGIGLAKAASYLFVLKRKQVVSHPEVNKLQEMVHKLLFRELSDALGEPARILEERATKGFRMKLMPDN